MSSISAGGEATSLKPHSPFGTFRRAWWVREDEQLTAEESASTLFRFFRSEHVIDLRLIAELALYLFIFHFVFVIGFSAVNPLAHSIFHFFKVQPTPVGPGEMVLRVFDKLTSDTLRSLVIYFSPAIPIYGAIVAWAYRSAARRLGVVDLFACEISTLCRVGTIFDIGKKYVEMHREKGSVAHKHITAKHLTENSAVAEQSSQSSASQEEYFPIFDNNSSDLQSLPALVVRHITEYYTYMKAMRDLLRKLASTDRAQISKSSENAPNSSIHSDEWHETLVNIIYVLFLGYESARKSIDDLIEFQPNRAENTIIILLTELVCYSFLCEYYKKDQVRFMRLQLRLTDYENVVPKLIKEVNSAYLGNQKKYWAPAQRTIAELKARYIAALDSVQQCAIMNNATSREVSITMHHHDKPIAAATPGSTILLAIQVQNKGLVPLRYSWTSASGKLVDSDTSSVALTLPRSQQETILFVEVTNEEGGALTASVAIPLADGSSHQAGPVLEILSDNGSL